MDELHIDIETRSRVDLKKYGMYRYARCPDFKIILAAWSLNGEQVESTSDEQEVNDIPGLWDPSVLKVAHNAPFERVCFSVFNERHRLGMELNPSGYLDPREYRDTMAVGAELGYAKSLAKMAHSLGADPKDEAGTRLINLFCKPNRSGGWNDWTTHPAEWLDFIAYCEQDVTTLIDVDRLLKEQGDWPTETEREVFLVDQIINDRGIAIDVPMAREAVKIGASVTEEQKDQVRLITRETGMEVENPGSLPQMHEWFDHMGNSLPDLKAETVERELLRPDIHPAVKQVLELRQELALAAPGKFSSALETQIDGRLRGTLRFFGAHTGRWAGQGTQPHNLPRASFKEDWEVEAAILDLMLGNGVSAQTLKKLVRPMFKVDGCVVDYSAIEAVVIAWLSGEDWALKAFREKRDIYVETAERMGGLSRAQGKIAVLALGFNGGANSLRAMAGDGDYYSPKTGAKVNAGTLGEASHEESAGSKLIKHATDDELYEEFVWPWRAANPNIVKLWKVLERRFRSGGEVGDHLAFQKANGLRDRLLRLPSGRFIGYRKAGIQKHMKFNARTNKLEEREVLTFWSPSGYRADTYGGRLAENATQAVARDLLAEALVRLERAGLKVVAHVHDEILVEGTKDVDAVTEIMTKVPSWAEGMPISGEGFACTRYKKG